MSAWRRSDVRAFVDRDWELLERSPSRRDAATSFALAGALREQARAQARNWPSEDDRRADLETHVRVAALLLRAHRAEPRRARPR